MGRVLDFDGFDLERRLPSLFTDTVNLIPLMLIVLLGIAIVLDMLRFGLSLSPLDDEASISDWRETLRPLLLAFGFAGAMSGIGGVLLASRLDVTNQLMQPVIGLDLLIQALAAVIIGGTSPYTRGGWLTGTVIAAIGVVALTYGLILEGENPFWILGGLLLGWLILHRYIEMTSDDNQPETEEAV